MNVDEFIMKFLEETFWREKVKSFSQRKFKIWAGNEEQNFFIRSYRSEIKCRERFGHKCGGWKKAKRRLGEVSRKRHSKNRAWRLWVDQVTIVALTNQVEELKETDLEGRSSCQHWKEEKSSMERNYRVIWNLQG